MPGYSSAEIEAAVANFVKSDVTVTYDVLGPVDIGAKFSEVLQLISSTLIFDPNAIFYLIYLASNRLNSNVEQSIEYLDDVIQAISEMSNRTTDVSRTTLLGDAAAALLDVDRILSERDALSQNAFNRYVDAIDTFTSVSLAPNIRKNAGIVRPPQQARTESRIALRSLSVAYEGLLETLDQVMVMLEEFNALDLAVISVQRSVRKVREDLRRLQSSFEDTGTTRDDKIAKCRDAYLRITAGKAVLTNYTTVTDPSEPRLISSATVLGRPALPVGSLGELIPASVNGSRSAPWAIETGVNDVLNIGEDGNVPTAYTLVPEALPSVRSVLSGPFNIHGATLASLLSSNSENYAIPAAPNNEFVVVVDGVVFAGSVTSGIRTGAQVVADISSITDVDTGTVALSTVANISYTTGILIEAITAGAHSIVVGDTYQSPIPSPSVNDILGFTSGQSSAGENANNKLEIDGLSPRISLSSGASQTRGAIASDITTWIGANYPGEYTAADDGTYITITKTKSGAQTLRITAEDLTDRPAILAALSALGFYEGQEDTAVGVSASEVARQINAVGLVTAKEVRETYEEGNDGDVTGATTIELPLDTIAPAGGVPEQHAGEHIYIRSGANAGPHRIVSIARTAVDTVTVSADTPFASVESDQSWVIVKEVLRLTSKSTSLDTQIEVSAGVGNTELGFAVGDEYGTTTGFRVSESGTDVDFTRNDIVVGDILRLSTADHTILELSDGGRQLEVTEPVPTNMAAGGFRVISAAAVAYEQFEADVVLWQQDRAASNFGEDISELERVMNPLLANKRPSQAQVADANNRANELKSLLTALTDVLISFQVRKVPRMDASLNMLLERGLDRAYDYLMDGKIAEFFGFDKDDAASAAYMLKTVRSVVQEDLAVSKLDEDADDITHSDLVRTTDADYDFSDMDEDEGFVTLGEVPDVLEEVDEDWYKQSY